MNYPLNKVIGDDETGFRGVGDDVYRMEGWDFVIAGGGLYNNLDYSFASGSEDGMFRYPPTQPGGGSRTLRQQLKILSDFINGFDFIRMTPDDSIIKGGIPAGGSARALVEPGKAIAIYVRKQRPTSGKEPAPSEADAGSPPALEIELADGEWRGEWVDTMTGSVVRTDTVRGGGVRALAPPDYGADIALRLRPAFALRASARQAQPGVASAFRRKIPMSTTRDP